MSCRATSSYASSCGPAGDRLTVLVRAPLEAMQDITFPTLGPGYLDAPRADSALRDAAQLWLANNIEAYEGERPLPLSIVAVRASIPSDRSFDSFDAARAHVHGTPLPAGTQLPWQQALLDVELEAPIASARSLFSLRPNLERLGVRVVTAVRFFAADGVERVFRSKEMPESFGSIRAGISRCCASSRSASSTFSTVPITCCSCSASSSRFAASCAPSSWS